MSTRHSKTRWAGAVALSATLLLAACGGEEQQQTQTAKDVGSMPSTAASLLTVGPFDIDGTIPDTAAGDGVPDMRVLNAPTTSAYGNVKELGPKNATTTKIGVIDNAAVAMLDYTNPNAQVDLRHAWAATTVDASGDVWLYFAWERDANSGSGFIAWEFGQDPPPAGCDYAKDDAYLVANCNPWANRKAGATPDFLLLWDQQGGSKDILIRKYNGTGFDPVSTLPAGTYAAQFSADGFKGEALINLTDTVFASGTCTSFSNVIPSTVTGNSDTADYKDTILGDFGITISNCGTVQVKKVTNPNDTTTSFGYTLSRTTSGALVKYDPSPGVTSVTGTVKTGQTPVETITNVLIGSDFTLGESTVPTNWVLQTIVCVEKGGTSYQVYPIVSGNPNGTFPVKASETTVCTMTNKLNQGAVKITKLAKNKGLDSELNPGPHPLNGVDFSVSDGTTTATCKTAVDGTCCIAQLPFGSYTITETAAPTGYKKAASQSLAIVANADCTVTSPNAPVAKTFVDVPLSTLVFKREVTFTSQGGKDVTAATLQCTDDPVDTGTGALPSTVATMEQSSSGVATISRTRTFSDIEVYPKTYTFSCTVVVDP